MHDSGVGVGRVVGGGAFLGILHVTLKFEILIFSERGAKPRNSALDLRIIGIYKKYIFKY